MHVRAAVRAVALTALISPTKCLHMLTVSDHQFCKRLALT